MLTRHHGQIWPSVSGALWGADVFQSKVSLIMEGYSLFANDVISSHSTPSWFILQITLVVCSKKVLSFYYFIVSLSVLLMLIETFRVKTLLRELFVLLIPDEGLRSKLRNLVYRLGKESIF